MLAGIRYANHGDLEHLLELERRCFRGAYSTHRFEARQFEYYLANKAARLLVATPDGQARAYILGLLGNRSRQHHARILSLAVDPSWRRRGLGLSLSREVVAACQTAGRHIISLEVFAGNRGALSLFESMGFKRMRRLHDYYGEGADGIRLRLNPAIKD